jgi:hypothetical protein
MAHKTGVLAHNAVAEKYHYWEKKQNTGKMPVGV